MSRLKIRGGRIIDPANEVDEVRDLWIEDGKVVAASDDPEIRAEHVIDARGYVVLPGGVDMHCHIAGSKVNAARGLRPEDKVGHIARTEGRRSGTTGSVPTTFATGYQYAGLGYTTAVDAAIAPLGARHAHFELRHTPGIDKAFLALMGNNHYVMDRIREGNRGRLRDFVAWLLGATGAYGVKIVNPGGIERWKQGQGQGHVSTLEDRVAGFDITPRKILTELGRATDDLGLPHPVHVHGLNLGLPGNAATTLETLQALDGHRAHMAHIQFHSYGGSLEKPGKIVSNVESLANYINTHKNISVDVGQVVFGDTTSMTADGAVGHFLHGVTGRKWLNHDVENETGCGVVPIEYEEKNLIHAVQWAAGLEWFLRVDDPWKIALSTDHPNGGSFLAYPRIIALLMSSDLRAEALNTLPDRVRSRSGLADLSREYSLNEIAIITRSAPARILGMTSKGHLGPGADGDVAIYSPNDDRAAMFALPKYVIQSGRVVIDDGEPRPAPEGLTLSTAPEFDPAILPDIEAWFERSSSIQFGNFAITAEGQDR